MYSQENANQWDGIDKRLRAANVSYCIVPLSQVRRAADLGDRKVLFLPNIETLTPAQAIALEEWMSKGGRLIASGPTASLSAPGVRQLMRTLLGGYWGFSLNQAQNLRPSKTNFRRWSEEDGLFGKVRGGVVVPENLAAQTAAVWDSKDSPTAVLATQRATFFGWRWGVDTAASPELDIAWLNKTIQHYMNTPGIKSTVVGGSTNCLNSVAKLQQPKQTSYASGTSLSTGLGSNDSNNFNNPKNSSNSNNSKVSRTSTQVSPSHNREIIQIKPRQRQFEAIDHLQDRIPPATTPNSRGTISHPQTLALQRDLGNLIGRVKSANLAARARNGNINFQQTALKQAVTPTQDTLAQAKKLLNNLPNLIATKKYHRARQKVTSAKARLWQQFPVNNLFAPPEIRSIWLDRGTIVRAANEKGLAKIFDNLAKAGINTVFFETLNAGYTIYPSKVAPQQNPLIRGWDPLASAVKLARERGIELHAWVWVFAAGNQSHNKILNIKSNYPGPVLAKHPEWAAYDNRGRMIPSGQNKPFFDPANPQVRKYLLELYEEIVTRYQVDGLQLDYIRYPFQDPRANRTYGYGKTARTQFKQKWGLDPLSISPRQRDLWNKWTKFRTESVDSFVSEVSQRLRKKKPNLILSAAVFPLPKRERIQKLQQHWEVWAMRGDIDLIVPMTYALDTYRFEKLAQPWIISRELGSSLLVPGIRLLNLPTLGAFDQIQLIRDLPASGYALFAAENLNPQLQKVFSRTQGQMGTANTQPIPHRQPFQTATIRYEALQAEWKLVSQSRELQISAKELTKFKSQAKVLQEALEQLADNPNSSQLVTAKASLTRFQSQFRIWMRSHLRQNPYQVKVWENRLATIERLLRYGENLQRVRRVQ
ncbi:family 10 glycosylhydrolase [Mastigocoleus sp. MO_188.B34]|uniref:family 10 glycosylhydrolase n=1 Tax=Mastigocoleus sp. MO_188.B34 TaxID=3036635 RepID=UPI00261E393A|nr:family 10 glycosylhydrolase [Mastigocoleus sp. MO_188.B34]MDJ0695555.1 family 10 glycosylhydrolase [Mastigocoleus sp. MO_188.B34]